MPRRVLGPHEKAVKASLAKLPELPAESDALQAEALGCARFLDNNPDSLSYAAVARELRATITQLAALAKAKAEKDESDPIARLGDVLGDAV